MLNTIKLILLQIRGKLASPEIFIHSEILVRREQEQATATLQYAKHMHMYPLPSHRRKYKEAIEHYTKAIEIDPSSEIAALCFSNRSAAYQVRFTRSYAVCIYMHAHTCVFKSKFCVCTFT